MQREFVRLQLWFLQTGYWWVPTLTLPFRFSHLKLGKIWRCFHVWDRSLLAISLPFFFLVTETGEISFERTRRLNWGNWFFLKGIYTGYFIFYFAIKYTPSHEQVTIMYDLAASGYISSFCSTISSTLLIVYRIHNSLSNQDNRSKKRFRHIVDVLVQSATLYSLALMVPAIGLIVPIACGNKFTLSTFAMETYGATPILFFVSVHPFGVWILGKVSWDLNQGIAPTIMVTRVILATDSNLTVDSTNVHISGLQFQWNSGIESDINGGRVVNSHSSRALENQKV
jgi:hypothetical protein